jgi:hypothetical protein
MKTYCLTIQFQYGIENHLFQSNAYHSDELEDRIYEVVEALGIEYNEDDEIVTITEVIASSLPVVTLTPESAS